MCIDIVGVIVWRLVTRSIERSNGVNKRDGAPYDDEETEAMAHGFIR